MLDASSLVGRGSLAFLQLVLLLLGLAIFLWLLWVPQVDGANVHKTLTQIYLHDPFIAYAYAASIAFFTALYQAFKLLGLVRRSHIFSLSAVRALQTIKFCALALIAFVVGGELWIFLHASDDRAGGVFIGLLISLFSILVATAAATFESILRKAVDLQSESDLTV